MVQIQQVVAVLAGALLFGAPTAALAGPVASTPGFTGDTSKVKTAPAGVRPTVKLTDTLDVPKPHVAVDDAGTAYITWLLATDPTSTTPGGIGFCRLPRGASACTNPQSTRVLRPQKDYGPGDSPAYNQDAAAGAFPVIVGEQLAIFTTRDITTYVTPSGESTSTTIAFVSADAGDSFTGGAPVAGDVVMATRPLAFGPSTNPLIGLLGPSSNGAMADDAVVFNTIAAGAFAGQSFRIGTQDGGVNSSELPDALAPLPGGGIAAAYTSRERNTSGKPTATFVRRSPGSGLPDAGSFSPPQRVAVGAEQERTEARASLANSPRGLLAGGIGGAAKSLEGRPVVTPDDGGAPVALAADSGNDLLLANAGGRADGQVIASFVDTANPGNNGKVVQDTGLYVRRSTDGRSFTPAERLTTDSDVVHRTDIAAAPDGGGFAVFQQGRTSFADATVQVASFGPQARSALPGLPGTVPGEGSALGTVSRSCKEISVAAVTITTVAGCFLNGTGEDKGKSVSNGPVLYNGLRITPLDGGQIVLAIDKADKTLKLYTTGDATVVVPATEGGDVEIFKGQLKQAIGATEGKPILDLPAYPTVVRGFKVKNQLAPLAHKGGVKIPVELDLGPDLLHQSSHVDLIVTAPPRSGLRDVGVGGVSAGLSSDSLHVHVDELPVGGVIIRDLDFTWTREGNIWMGKGTVLLPPLGVGPKLDIDVKFSGDSFSANAAYRPPFPGIFLFAPAVFLHEIAAGFDVNGSRQPPIVIRGGVKIGAVPLVPGADGFPAFPGGPVDPIYALDLDAAPPDNGVTLTFGKVFEFKATGELKLLSLISVAQASFVFRSTGYAHFDATFGLGAKPYLFVGGGVSIGVSGNGFNAETMLQACGLGLCGGGDAIVSSRGIAVCLEDPVKNVQVSYDFGSDDFDADFGCNFTPLRVAVRRGTGRQAGAVVGGAIPVPAGAKALTLNLHTAGGEPAVDLIDPSGAPVPVDGKVVSYYPSPPTNSGVITVTNPTAGNWRVVARSGSPALTRVKASVPAPEPKVTARVSKPGKGGRRTLTYKLAGDPNATVAFTERTREGDQLLKGSGKSGTLTFTPNVQTAGKHEIRAQIAGASGLPSMVKSVASFTQPAPPRPRAPKRVRVTRVGSALRVTVTPAGSGKTPFLVVARHGEGGGTTALIPANKTSVKIAGPARSLDAPGSTRITVQALSAAGRRGPPKTVNVSARGLQRKASRRRPSRGTLGGGQNCTPTHCPSSGIRPN